MFKANKVRVAVLGIMLVMAGSIILASNVWAQQKKVTIGALLGSAEWSNILRERIGEFYKKHPNIEVDFTYLSHKECVDKVMIELSSGSPTYDIVYYDNFDFPTYASPGWLEPQEPWIKRDAADLDVDDFFEGPMDAISYGGKLYGLPVYAECQVLMFRADLFLKYGVRVPDTVESLWEAAEKLTLDIDGDGKVDIYGFTGRGDRFYGYILYGFSPFLKGYGGAYFDKNWNPIFNNSAGKEAAKTYVELLQKFGPPGAGSYGWHECITMMQQGRAAIWQDGASFPRRMENPEESSMVGKFGYAPPSRGPVKRAGPLYVASWGMNAKSRHKEEAWQFLKYAYSKEINYTREAGNPTRKSWLERPETRKEHSYGAPGYIMTEIWDEAMACSEPPFAKIPEWPEVGSIVGEALNSVLVGAKDLDGAFAEAFERVRKVMERSGYYK